jgi:hypothetical protein
MALNIKNRETVDQVRLLARATGATMTGAVSDAVGRRLRELSSQDRRADAARKREIQRRLSELWEGLTDAERAAVAAAQADLYDANGLPR